MSVAAVPPTAALAAELEQRVAGLWWELTQSVPSELSRTAASVLANLEVDGPQRVTALAARERVSQPAMSLLLQRVERLGLVTRESDPADRRATLVAITRDGQHALEERAASRSLWLEVRLTQLDPGAREALAAALPALDALLGTEVAA